MFDFYALAVLFTGGVMTSLLVDAALIKSRSAPKIHYPLSLAQVTAAFPQGTWQRKAYEDYKSVLLDEELIFPCVYDTKGLKSDSQLYFGLSTYLPQARQLGPNTSLVILAKQNDNNSRTVEEYNTMFWELLNGLAKLDDKPWPSTVPRDIDTDKWCFCFGGEKIFPVLQTPAHQARRTRYAPGVTMVFQPKWTFDILFSTDTKRAGAIAKVRALLAKYDPIPISPELKPYGEEGSREYKQYFLMDENVPAPCPYNKLSDSQVIVA
ncbi:hypothetical protein BDR04DRAFT_1175448 [Suillus decipiens]|nr:hypothetical protein BDR04DRAFT_1175448 [Suillus decipiens]